MKVIKLNILVNEKDEDAEVLFLNTSQIILFEGFDIDNKIYTRLYTLFSYNGTPYNYDNLQYKNGKIYEPIICLESPEEIMKLLNEVA